MVCGLQTWRRWHRKVNINQKRYAVASALAASALPSLVMARGHRIEAVTEVPLVVDDSAGSLQKTSAAVALLKKVWTGGTPGTPNPFRAHARAKQSDAELVAAEAEAGACCQFCRMA